MRTRYHRILPNRNRTSRRLIQSFEAQIGGDNRLPPQRANAANASKCAEWKLAHSPGACGAADFWREQQGECGDGAEQTPSAKASNVPGRPSQAASMAISLASPRPMPS